MSKLNNLPIGTRIETMLHGFICPVEVIGVHVTVNGPGSEDVVYDVKYMGDRKCLDFGANMWINNGDKTWTRPMNIARAAEWRTKGY